LKNFRGISQEPFHVTNSSEILETQFREIHEKLSGTFPQEILEKFSGLGHQVHGFLGELNERISYEKFQGYSLESPPRNF